MQAGTTSLARYPAAYDVPPPRLLVELEPWARQFGRNLADLFRPEPPPLLLTSRPAPFWTDVFVLRPPNWRAVGSSAFMHAALIGSILGMWDLITRTQVVVPQNPLKHETLTYYEVSEYLPPILSQSAPAKVTQKGQPEYARQRIVSVPIGADNSRQTIVNPKAPQIIHQDIPLPNLAVWTAAPAMQPVAASERSAAQLTVPLSIIAPIQPRPEMIARNPNQLASSGLTAAAVVEPPVALDDARRPIGEMNISAVEPLLAQPQLPVAAQRTSTAVGEGRDLAVPPQPSAHSSGGAGAQAAGQLLVLNVRPAAPSGDIKIPEGSRRGVFAATPEGKPGAPGTPDIYGGGSGPGGSPTGTGSGSGPNAGAGVPGISITGGPLTPGSGAVVAQAPSSSSRPGSGSGSPTGENNRLLADARPPSRLGDVLRPEDRSPATPGSTSTPSEEEKKVFSGRKYYTMTMNMPNLTSASGSWIVRFVEMDPASRGGDLTAPIARNKVDPGYPPDLVQRRVEGVVVLYAVIRANGTVDSIRVLHGVEERLDRSAQRALARWQFEPATKNGQAVDLEAVVQIPFQVRKLAF